MNYELWALFGSSFIASTLLPGGSEIGLAWLANQQDANIGLLILIATIGNTLGGFLTYGFGFIIAQYYPAKALDQTHQKRAKKILLKQGPLMLLFSWLPFIGDPLCLLAGWLKLNLALSFLFIFLGKLARYLLIVSFFS